MGVKEIYVIETHQTQLKVLLKKTSIKPRPAYGKELWLIIKKVKQELKLQIATTTGTDIKLVERAMSSMWIYKDGSYDKAESNREGQFQW